MGKQTNYYSILGLPVGATTSEIKARYKTLAKQYHPDHDGDTELMSGLNLAYSVLSDPQSRFEYNRSLKKPQPKSTVSQTVYQKPASSDVFGKPKAPSTNRRTRNHPAFFGLMASPLALIVILIAVVALITDFSQNNAKTNLTTLQPITPSTTVSGSNTSSNNLNEATPFANQTPSGAATGQSSTQNTSLSNPVSGSDTATTPTTSTCPTEATIDSQIDQTDQNIRKINRDINRLQNDQAAQTPAESSTSPITNQPSYLSLEQQLAAQEADLQTEENQAAINC